MNNDKFFPFFLNLSNKKVLIIGGGKIACRKIKVLKDLCESIDVYSEEFNEEIIQCKKNKLVENINIIKKTILEENLSKLITKKYFLIIAATNNEELNHKISNCANRKNILVNNITSKNDMNTRFSSTIESENFTIGISGNGDASIGKNIKSKILKFIKR